MTINTTIYYVLSDELHSYILWHLSAHLQATEVHKGKITTVSSFLCG